MYDLTSGGRAGVLAAWAAPDIASNTESFYESITQQATSQKTQ